MERPSLKDLLSEKSIPSKDFGKIFFGGNKTFAKQQKSKQDAEPDTPVEFSLYDALTSWVSHSNSRVAREIKALLPVIKAQMHKFPRYLKPKTPNGTVLYRGLSDISKQTLVKLKKVKPENWMPITVGGGHAYLCTIPFKYEPHLEVQSWTPDENTAEGFMYRAILVTKQDDSFVFNEQVFANLFYKNEHEILHVGKKYQGKVYIAVTRDYYQYYIKPQIPTLKSVQKSLFKPQKKK